MLYEIISPEGKKSFLFGTIHINDNEVVTLPLEVKEAFDKADICLFEVDINGNFRDPAIQQFKQWLSKYCCSYSPVAKMLEKRSQINRFL